MKGKIMIFGLLVLALILAGCVQPTPPTPDNNVTPPTPPTNGGNGGTADACTGVSCDNKCEGTTYYSDGFCVDGSCVYSSTENNSTQCGFTARPPQFAGMDFEASLYSCDYDPYEDHIVLFFPIKNTGSVATQKGYVELVADGLPNRQFKILNKTYLPGKYLWEETTLTKSYDKQKGLEVDFTIDNPNFGYQLIYCLMPDDALPGVYPPCTDSIGLVLAQGNTSEKCA
jgi:hypothetical protein